MSMAVRLNIHDLMKMGALEGCVCVFAFISITSSSSQIEDNDGRRRKLVMSK
jgi:hypothetical protein